VCLWSGAPGARLPVWTLFSSQRPDRAVTENYSNPMGMFPGGEVSTPI
jgi:hypothetical protein